jgi:hypothetical protein
MPKATHEKKSHQNDLDQEENELLISFEKGDWKTVKNIEKEKTRARKTAAKTLRKDAAKLVF